MNTFGNNSSSPKAAVTGLAVVGFVALVAAGMWLAVYSTRFVPTVVNHAGEAVVYLGSIFKPTPASLSVVPTPTLSTTISFGETSSTTSTTVPTTKPTPSVPPKTTAGEGTTVTEQISGAAATPALSGLSDLVVTIKDVGYLATSSADSFVATTTIPVGSRPAIAFTIKNIGTNTTGSWRFRATIPTQTAYIYESQLQQSLNPGDSIDYTLGFDQANKGAGQTISVTVNPDRTVTESNTNNNSASIKVTILGS